MGSALYLILLFIKSKLYYKEVNAGVIIVNIIHNKPANLTTKIILSNNIANNIIIVIAAI
jgi:hypothetical protein